MKIWKRKNFFSRVLLPVSGLYRMGMAIRWYFYLHGYLKITRFPVPVIVVGNITVGGTGKTPLVIYLANRLQQEGWKPGIVSRGYKGDQTQSPQPVLKDSHTRHVGDEAVLIAQKTRCPILVCHNRVAAALALLRDHHCDIILSDDGLQHLALGRDVEIAVIDGERRFGNTYCLPAGPLREPVARLKTVDFVVNNGVSVSGEWRMDLEPQRIYSILYPQKILNSADLQDKLVHAVAAIGNPQRFFQLLEKLGFKVVAHPFPDHYFFKPKDIDFGKDAAVIMTEKDAVKCREFADHRHWCLEVKPQLPEEFIQLLLNKVQQRE